MSHPNKRPPSSAQDTFVVDASYLRVQAREAFTTFLAPLSGVYSAAFGSRAAYPKTNGVKAKKRA